MRARIARVRAKIAAADPRLAYIGEQYGMFSMLPLDIEQVRKLRDEQAIYMADSGRFNVLGMADARARPLHRRGHRGDEWLRRTRSWTAAVDWSRSGAAGDDEPGARPSRGDPPRSREEGALPIFGARA